MDAIATLKVRLNWIDYAKGVGIIFVVFGHVIKGLYSAKLINPVFFYYAVNFVYSFHMPLFFILSGYFFVKSFLKRGTREFILNKFETILYPFVIWSLLQTFIEIKLSAYTNNHVKSSELLTCLYLPRSQFWFLFALFFINILCVFFFKLSKKWGVLFSICVCVVYYLMNYQLYVFDKTFVNLIYFTFGIVLSQRNNITKQLLQNAYIFLLNIVIFSGSLYLYFNFTKTEWYNLLLPQLSGSFVIIYVSERMCNHKAFSIIQYLGVNSLIIYLVHMLAGNGTRIFLNKVLHIQNSSIHIIAGTILGLLIPLMVYKLAMMTKYLSWLFQFPALKQNRETTEIN
jgi:fucose 4-O-acetylase-like acetyltransferase